MQTFNLSAQNQQKQKDSINLVKKQYHSSDSILYYYTVKDHKDFYFEQIHLFDNKKIVILRDKDKTDRRYIVRNNRITDTLKKARYALPYIYENALLLHGFGGRVENPYHNFYKVDISTGKKNLILKNDSISFTEKYKNLLVGKKEKYSEETYNDFFIYNLDDRSLKEISSFTDNTVYAPIQNFTFLNKKEIFIWTAHAYANWFDADEFYKFNMQTGDIIPLNEKIKKQYIKLLPEEQREYFDFNELDGGGETLINNNPMIDYKQHFDTNYLRIVLDKNINFIAKIPFKLDFYPTRGLTVINKKIVKKQYQSKDKKQNKIVIPFKYSLSYMKALSAIYTNQQLTKKDLNGLDLENVLILKNFVFARHHYNFNSSFYQAYFNLFYFYSNTDNEKTKNVNSLLTETDKYNLKLIKKEIERRKK
jgi:hypothetical protein